MNLKKFNPTRLDVTVENVGFKIIDIDKGEFEESFQDICTRFMSFTILLAEKGV